MNDTCPVFVSLRFVVTENIGNAYRILQYLTEWPMVVGEKPETHDNDFFRNNDWPEFFANNGNVALGNFMAYGDMGVEKVFSINSYVPRSRRNTVYYFVKWLSGCLEFDRPETVFGYMDYGDYCELLTSRRMIPVSFKTPEAVPAQAEENKTAQSRLDSADGKG